MITTYDRFRALLLPCSLLLAGPLVAQQFAWQATDNGDINGRRFTVDGAGNAYMAGFAGAGADMDPGAGSDALAATGGFLSKFDASGAYQWTAGFTCSGLCDPRDVAVDADGNIIVVGRFNGTMDFDPGPGVSQLTSSSSISYDAFVIKLDPSGTLLWRRRLQQTQAYRVVAAPNGNLWITGLFYQNTDFDPSSATHMLNATSETFFIWGLDGTGNYTAAGELDPSQSSPYIMGLAVNNAGEPIIAGSFQGTLDMDPGPGTHNVTTSGGYRGFVIKLSSTCTLQWEADALVGDGMYDVAVDADGNVVASGYFNGDLGSADMDPGSGTYLISCSGFCPFLWKLSDAGSLVWARVFADANNWQEVSVAVDASNNVVMTGLGLGDMDPGPGTNAVQSGCFIAALNEQGDALWGGSLALAPGLGTDGDQVWNVATDPSGSIYVGGRFQGTADLDPGPGVVAVVGDTITEMAPEEMGSSYLVKLDPLALHVTEVASPTIHLYPVPADDRLFVQSPSPVLRSRLLALDGRVMRSYGDLTTLDLHGLASGAYVAEVYTLAGRVVQRVIVR